VSFIVIGLNNKPLHLRWVGGRNQNKKEKKGISVLAEGLSAFQESLDRAVGWFVRSFVAQPTKRSVKSTAETLRLDAEVYNLDFRQAEKFSLHQITHAGSVTHSASYPMDTIGCFPEIK
jgi:hypothetical protein